VSATLCHHNSITSCWFQDARRVVRSVRIHVNVGRLRLLTGVVNNQSVGTAPLRKLLVTCVTDKLVWGRAGCP